MRASLLVLLLTACGPATLVGADGDGGAATDTGEDSGADAGGTDTGDDSGSDGGSDDSGTDGGDDSGSDGGDPDDLANDITEDGLMRHLEALQALADDHNDRRSLGTDGYSESAEYVVEQLAAAGYEVERWPFSYTTWIENEISFEQLSPDPTVYDDGDDFAVFSYSGVGTATGQLVAVDVMIPPGDTENSSDSGCESADFVDFPSGAVALIQRGTCNFSTKAANAEAAGAVAVVVFNEGQSGRTDVVSGTLDSSDPAGVPVIGIGYDLGASFAEDSTATDGGVTVEITVDAGYEDVDSENLIVTLAGEDPDTVYVTGSHLDSVPAGPGINDNGSGTATVLEIALAAKARDEAPKNTLQFSWWGAEEYGLVGSYDWVSGISSEERSKIAGYLNFDMVASPNPVAFVYDGSEGSNGSDTIEDIFGSWLDSQGQPWTTASVGGRADSYSFLLFDIPIGGLFTGAEVIKTSSQAETWGGSAGVAFDPCYHKDCDDIDNLDLAMFVEMATAAAHSVHTVGQLEEPLGGRSDATRSAATRPEQVFEAPAGTLGAGCHSEGARPMLPTR